MQADEEAIRALVANWMAASKSGDKKILSLMTDDVVFLTPGRPPMDKSVFIAALSAPPSFDMETVSEIKEIKVLGDWAYMWTQLAVTMTPKNGGAPIKRAGHTLSVLRKQQGSWAIARDANMLALVSS